MGLIGRILPLATLVCLAIVGLSMVPEAREAVPELQKLHYARVEAWARLRPGGAWHPAGFIEHHGHLVLEGSLLLVIFYLLIQSSSKPSGRKSDRPLSEKEVQELCDEWQPEPLGAPLTEFQRAFVDTPLVNSSTVGRVATINGRAGVLDFVSLNFLGLAGHPDILAAAHATIRRFGVGSCGPRGFYGTLDVHLELEAALAKYMGTQEAILYSYDLATLPSIIPAFANRKDVIVADEGCNYAIRNGCSLSRARVIYFKHNDVADLERILKQIANEDRKQSRPLNRRFVVVEGVYANTGEVAPLAAIAELKNKFKYRLIVDDSVGLGVLGASGRGASEEAGLDSDDVEIVGASLGNSLATIGGFCAGDREIVDHQRLSGAGYCFSASLPPYLASAGTAALAIISAEGGERSKKARSNAQRFRSGVLNAKISNLKVVGGAESATSPLVHLRLDPAPATHANYPAGDLLLQHLVEDCLNKEGVLFTVSKYSNLEAAYRPPPSIRIALSAAHTFDDVDQAIAALTASAKRILKPRRS
jgi:serine palmitoyltransferase